MNPIQMVKVSIWRMLSSWFQGSSQTSTCASGKSSSIQSISCSCTLKCSPCSCSDSSLFILAFCHLLVHVDLLTCTCFCILWSRIDQIIPAILWFSKENTHGIWSRQFVLNILTVRVGQTQRETVCDITHRKHLHNTIGARVVKGIASHVITIQFSIRTHSVLRWRLQSNHLTHPYIRCACRTDFVFLSLVWIIFPIYLIPAILTVGQI